LLIFNVLDIKLSVFISFGLKTSTFNVFVLICSVSIFFVVKLLLIKLLIFASLELILSEFNILFNILSDDKTCKFNLSKSKLFNFKLSIFAFNTFKFDISKLLLIFKLLSVTCKIPFSNVGKPTTSSIKTALSNATIFEPELSTQNIFLPSLFFIVK